jgi:hypothetical protein
MRFVIEIPDPDETGIAVWELREIVRDVAGSISENLQTYRVEGETFNVCGFTISWRLEKGNE